MRAVRREWTFWASPLASPWVSSAMNRPPTWGPSGNNPVFKLTLVEIILYASWMTVNAQYSILDPFSDKVKYSLCPVTYFLSRHSQTLWLKFCRSVWKPVPWGTDINTSLDVSIVSTVLRFSFLLTFARKFRMMPIRFTSLMALTFWSQTKNTLDVFPAVRSKTSSQTRTSN